MQYNHKNMQKTLDMTIHLPDDFTSEDAKELGEIVSQFKRKPKMLSPSVFGQVLGMSVIVDSNLEPGTAAIVSYDGKQCIVIRDVHDIDPVEIQKNFSTGQKHACLAKNINALDYAKAFYMKTPLDIHKVNKVMEAHEFRAKNPHNVVSDLGKPTSREEAVTKKAMDSFLDGIPEQPFDEYRKKLEGDIVKSMGIPDPSIFNNTGGIAGGYLGGAGGGAMIGGASAGSYRTPDRVFMDALNQLMIHKGAFMDQTHEEFLQTLAREMKAKKTPKLDPRWNKLIEFKLTV